jgi:xanthine dehydrogenase YagS FAD-binding subunit
MFMELPEVKHVDAKDFQKAVYWLKEYGDRARVIAGATDLLSLMKDRIEGPGLRTPEVLVNVKTIPEMNEIGHDKSGWLRIGAGVTLDRIETSQIINEKFPILSQAASQVGTIQLRNMGTLGGNICQRPRCMYFRHPHFVCRKKGGEKCFAIGGEHRDHYAIINNGKCVMAHPSDMAPALVALNAKVVIAGSDGKREIPLQKLFLGPNEVTETILQPEEILTEFLVPNQKEKLYQLFLKQRIRRSFDFALTSVAAVAQIDKEVCTDIRMVLGGVAPFPYVAMEVEQVLKGKKFSNELISTAADASVKGARPLPMNNYKRDLTRVSVLRVLKMLWQKSVASAPDDLVKRSHTHG